MKLFCATGFIAHDAAAQAPKRGSGLSILLQLNNSEPGRSNRQVFRQWMSGFFYGAHLPGTQCVVGNSVWSPAFRRWGA